MNNKNIRYFTLLFIVAILLLSGGIGIYICLKKKPPHYSNFGLSIPNGYPHLGIDVSRHQGEIFWDDVAAMRDQNKQISFVFIKATDGVNMQDNSFHDNFKSAQDAGVLCGAYHYFHPTHNATAQANNFLATTTLAAGNFRPVLDVEVTENIPPNALRDSICQWLTIVGNCHRTTPIIYTGASFYNQYLKGFFDDYPLWVAHYRSEMPGVKSDFQFWQFSDCGRVNGINGKVDFNVFAGDSAALNNYLLR